METEKHKEEREVKEVSLSNKILYPVGHKEIKAYNNGVIKTNSVKAFIKILLDGLDRDYKNGDIGMAQYHRRRDEITKYAGDKLF